jgi:hypothetical protein
MGFEGRGRLACVEPAAVARGLAGASDEGGRVRSPRQRAFVRPGLPKEVRPNRHITYFARVDATSAPLESSGAGTPSSACRAPYSLLYRFALEAAGRIRALLKLTIGAAANLW